MTPDWPTIERQYRTGAVSVKELADHHGLSDSTIHKRAKANGWTRDIAEEATDWDAIERDYRPGQLSLKEIGRQHSISDTAIRKHAKAHGWTRDLAGAVRHRVRESLVREGVRANQLAGVTPSDAAVVDEAAARGVAVVRSHRSDIRGLREAVAELLAELRPNPQGRWEGADEIPLTHRARVIADLSAAMARIIPLERQAFGLDEDKPLGSQPMTVVWEGMPSPAYD